MPVFAGGAAIGRLAGELGLAAGLATATGVDVRITALRAQLSIHDTHIHIYTHTHSTYRHLLTYDDSDPNPPQTESITVPRSHPPHKALPRAAWPQIRIFALLARFSPSPPLPSSLPISTSSPLHSPLATRSPLSCPQVYAGGYAVVGAAALTAGVTGTVSIAVIVFELTNQLHHMMPVLLAVVVARAVAGRLSPNIYDIMGSNLRLLTNPELRHQDSYYLTVKDIMSSLGSAFLPRKVR